VAALARQIYLLSNLEEALLKLVELEGLSYSEDSCIDDNLLAISKWGY